LLYDCFTAIPIVTLEEDYGFYAKSKGGPGVENGREINGELPVNTHEK
jgi:hypothetical protein